MDENCGKTLNLDTYFRLQASRKSSLSSGLNCSVDIYATSKKLGGSARVHARLLSINMPFSTAVSGCDRVKLELHDGIRNKTLLTRMFIIGVGNLQIYTYQRSFVCLSRFLISIVIVFLNFA